MDLQLSKISKGLFRFIQKSNRVYRSVEVCRSHTTKSLPKRLPIGGVEKILLVAAGKGGVGKSTVAANLALGLQQCRKDLKVGLLDADIYGPSIPTIMLLKGQMDVDHKNLLIPLKNYGIKCASMGFLIEQEDSAIVWRGLMVMSAIQKLLRQVSWGPLDILVVDMPPGTGDVLLSMAQNVPVHGTVLVTTPQDIALKDVRKCAQALKKLEIPIHGIVANMAHHECSECGHVEHVFGRDGAHKYAQELGVDVLGSIPLSLQVRETSDAGTPIVVSMPSSPQAKAFTEISSKVLTKLYAS